MIITADDSAALLYRGMQADEDDQPRCGPTARMLGVRPDVDLAVSADGEVMPGQGGLSVTPSDPMLLPRHRRPPAFGGTGKDPLRQIAIGDLGQGLRYRADPLDPTRHGFIEPASVTTLALFQEALVATRGFWQRSMSEDDSN
ncbi:MAG TPA: hypothetical protein VIL85_09250 [Thermomicrobiales bacterium]|jgi:hypothetical protein